MAEIRAVVRRLAAILAADVAGYSRLIEADEEGTLIRAASSRPPATVSWSSSPVSSTQSDAQPRCRRH